MRMILIFLATFLFANERLLITKFEDVKPYYYNHQIVNLKLKIISATDGNLKVFDDYNNSYPVIDNNESYISNISFELNNSFPIFHVVLSDNGVILNQVDITLDAKVRNLYPPKNFCGVLADDLNISDKILTNYDDKNNIVYWTINSKNGNLNDFSLHFKDEKLYSIDNNNTEISYSYSALVPVNHTDFSFSYFNLKQEKYKNINFSIKLKNETVSTQTDIKPMSKNNIYIINILLGVFVLLWIVLFIYRRGWIYIILLLITIGVIVFFNLPKKEIILHQNTKIHILPFEKSTIFVVVGNDTKVKVLLTKDGWSKIEFNNYIGWVKND